MKRPYLIGITGGSGSGKTTFLRQLAASFSEDDLCIVSQDDYYHPREKQLQDNKGVKNFDLPSSIDDESFFNDLTKLINGESFIREEYTFNNELAEPELLTIKPAPIIVVEGIFIFHYPKIRNLLNLKVFIHAKEEFKVIRRIKRDREERNYPLDDVLYRYQHHVSPAFDQYTKPYMEISDLIINNHIYFDESLRVLRGFMKDMLREEG